MELDEDVSRFVEECEKVELKFQQKDMYSKERLCPYKSLSIIILDCVYSLNARYSCALNVIDRYLLECDNQDKYAEEHTLLELQNRIEEYDVKYFEDRVGNHQYVGGEEKAKVCRELAKLVALKGIDTPKGLISYKDITQLETEIKQIKGIGQAACDYLFMLSGDLNRCKVDVHIRDYVENDCHIKGLKDREYREMFVKAAEILKEKHGYIELTACGLDRLIWEYKSGAENKVCRRK